MSAAAQAGRPEISLDTPPLEFQIGGCSISASSTESAEKYFGNEIVESFFTVLEYLHIG